MSFQSPNYTQTPNDFFDMIAGMEESEVRVTLVMIRQTFGFHRDNFKMGLKKLALAAGLSRNGAKDGAEAAEKRGTFQRTNPDSLGEAEWSLIVDPPPSDHLSGQPVTTPPSTSDQQVGVKERLNKVIKKKDILDGILETQLKPKAIQDSIKENFKLTPNWETKFNRQFLQWAIQEQITCEQIKHAAQVWGSDKKFNWAHPNLKGIQEQWLQLIGGTHATTPPNRQPNAAIDPEQLERDRATAERIKARRATQQARV